MKPLTTWISRRHVLTTGTAVIALPAFESLGFRRCAAAAAGAQAARVSRLRLGRDGR
jgi:hypothetical protein